MRRILKFALWTLVLLLAAVCLTAAGFRIAAAVRETAEAADLAPASGKFIATRSGRVFIQEAGPRDGIPVVLFHGTAAWSELWRATMTALAGARFRAIALDIPLTVTNPLMTRTLLAQLIERKERAALYVDLLQRPMAVRDTTHDLGLWLLYFLGSDRDALSAQRAAYAKIDKKVAILWGEKDSVTPLAQAEDLRALMPAARLTLLPGLGHIPQIEDPDAFNRALVALVDEMK